MEFDEFNDIAIVAKYKRVNDILRELLYLDYKIVNIQLGKGDWIEYYDEYIISLFKHENVYEIWCEPMKRDGKYITDESTLIYIFDDCSSSCIPYCNSKFVFEINIQDKDEIFDTSVHEGKSVYISRDKNGNPESFSIYYNKGATLTSYSFYSSNVAILREIASDYNIDLDKIIAKNGL